MSAGAPQRIAALAQALGERLAARGLRLATAESCTGGGVGFAVTQVAGASAWFDRGFITYSNEAKRAQLGVSAALLRREGAVSEAVARAMALGALAAGRARIAVAVTGIAGPGGGSAAKPVGTVCFGWALAAGARDLRVVSARHLLRGDRAAVRTQSIEVALQGLLDLLDDAGRADGRPRRRTDPRAA